MSIVVTTKVSPFLSEVYSPTDARNPSHFFISQSDLADGMQIRRHNV